MSSNASGIYVINIDIKQSEQKLLHNTGNIVTLTGVPRVSNALLRILKASSASG